MSEDTDHDRDAALPVMVAVTASAMSPRSVEMLLERMPPRPDAAVAVVLQRREALDEDAFWRAAAKGGHARVDMEDGAVLAPGRLYLLSPGMIVTVGAGHVRMRPAGDAPGAQGVIDSFLLSLAREAGGFALAEAVGERRSRAACRSRSPPATTKAPSRRATRPCRGAGSRSRRRRPCASSSRDLMGSPRGRGIGRTGSCAPRAALGPPPGRPGRPTQSRGRARGRVPRGCEFPARTHEPACGGGTGSTQRGAMEVLRGRRRLADGQDVTWLAEPGRSRPAFRAKMPDDQGGQPDDITALASRSRPAPRQQGARPRASSRGIQGGRHGA